MTPEAKGVGRTPSKEALRALEVGMVPHLHAELELIFDDSRKDLSSRDFPLTVAALYYLLPLATPGVPRQEGEWSAERDWYNDFGPWAGVLPRTIAERWWRVYDQDVRRGLWALAEANDVSYREGKVLAMREAVVLTASHGDSPRDLIPAEKWLGEEGGTPLDSELRDLVRWFVKAAVVEAETNMVELITAESEILRLGSRKAAVNTDWLPSNPDRARTAPKATADADGGHQPETGGADRTPDYWDALDAAEAQQEAVLEFLTFLDSVTPREQDVLTTIRELYRDGWPERKVVKEAAARLGIAPETVYTYLRRTREKKERGEL